MDINICYRFYFRFSSLTSKPRPEIINFLREPHTFFMFSSRQIISVELHVCRPIISLTMQNKELGLLCYNRSTLVVNGRTFFITFALTT